MEDPTNVTELRRFLGMTNQLGRFSDKIAEVSKPLRDLLIPGCGKAHRKKHSTLSRNSSVVKT